MVRFSILFFCLILVLGCGQDENIIAVKNSYLFYDKSVLLGDVLDSRDVCDKTEWSFVVDKLNRKTVIYICTKDIEELVKSNEIVHLDDLKNRKQRELDNLKLELYDLQLKIDKARSENVNFNSELEKLKSETRDEIVQANEDVSNFRTAENIVDSKIKELNFRINNVKGEIYRVDSLPKDIELSNLSATCLSRLMGNDGVCTKSLEQFMHFSEFNSKLHKEILRLADNAVVIYKAKINLKENSKNIGTDAYGNPKGYDDLQKNEYINQNEFIKNTKQYIESLSAYKAEKLIELSNLNGEHLKLSKESEVYFDEISKAKSVIDNSNKEKAYLSDLIEVNNNYLSLWMQRSDDLSRKVLDLDVVYKNKLEFVNYKHQDVVEYVEVLGFTILVSGGYEVGALKSFFITKDGKSRLVNSGRFSLKKIYTGNNESYVNDILSSITSG